MTRDKALHCLAVFLALAVARCGAQAPAVPPVPSFTISGSNVTMQSNGSGSIPFTLTSVNGFVGTVGVACIPPTPAAGVLEPNWYQPGPVLGKVYHLTANATATGTFMLTSTEPLPSPSVGRLSSPGRRGEASWALAGMLMLGFGLSRRRRGYASLLLAVGMLLGLTGLNACGGPTTLTPGTYTYTLTATFSGQNNSPVSESTTVTVTVPPGIVVQPAPTGPVPL